MDDNINLKDKLAIICQNNEILNECIAEIRNVVKDTKEIDTDESKIEAFSLIENILEAI